jgi:hypothetical protein
MRPFLAITLVVALAFGLCGFQHGAQVIVSPYPAAGGSTTFTLVSGQTSSTGTNNTCTLPGNVTAGNVILWGGVINDLTTTVSAVKEGNGASLTITPQSPLSEATSTGQGWMAYTLSATGGSATVVATLVGGTTLRSTWCLEAHPTGAAPVFDTGATGTSSTGADISTSITLATTGELVAFVCRVAGAVSSVASPWTLWAITGNGNPGGYDLSGSGTITSNYTPAAAGPGLCLVEAIQ